MLVAGASYSAPFVDECRDRLRMRTPAVEVTATALSLLTKRLQMPRGADGLRPFLANGAAWMRVMRSSFATRAPVAHSGPCYGSRCGGRDYGPRGSQNTGRLSVSSAGLWDSCTGVRVAVARKAFSSEPSGRCQLSRWAICRAGFELFRSLRDVTFDLSVTATHLGPRHEALMGAAARWSWDEREKRSTGPKAAWRMWPTPRR